ncbi:MAG TPA: von Willebrand factor type A domain-containing protein [Thermoanaerobaculia bacterium]|jgi:Ca-activated chloride channel family protein
MNRIALVLLVLFTFACSQSTQTPSRTIAGVVTTEGVPLPGVTVSLTGPGQPLRTTVTDADGRYAFASLAPGSYVVRVALDGFQTTTTSVALPARRDAVLQTELRLASVSESITVTAETPLLVEDAIQETVRFAANGVYTDATGLPPERAFARVVTAAGAPEPAGPEPGAPVVEHGFVATAKQHTATFAIDVDRASYSSVRGYLARGLKPPVHAVRIEELVNYFTYNYPQPRDGAPFSVTTEVAGCPWNPANRLLRVGIQGRNIEHHQLAPFNLVFLIDVSGSMDSPKKLPLVVRAMSLLVDALRVEDRVSIVSYAGSAGVVLPPTSGADKEAIRAALQKLVAGGSTAGGEGIHHAYRLARENFIRNGNNRVVLATDGDFNVGVSTVPELQELIEEKRRTGVFLSVIGVGEGNERDNVMETLADKGNGNYSFLDSESEAEKVFRRELAGTLVTIAKDVKVQLEFDPAAVQSYRQIGYENRALAAKDFDDDQKDAGELGAGHSVTALFELVPAPGSRGRLGTLRVRYKEPDGDTSKPLVADLVDEGKSAYAASADLQFAAAVAELGMLLRDSPHKGSATWDDVFQLARVSLGPDLDGERQEFLEIAEVARALK